MELKVLQRSNGKQVKIVLNLASARTLMCHACLDLLLLKAQMYARFSSL